MTLKLKRILIFVLSVLLCVCGTVALKLNATNSTFSASAEVIDVTITDVQNFYMLNDRKAFPESIEVQVDPDDAQSMITAVDGVILYPNDVAYSISSKEYIFNIVGSYKLKYFGEYQGREIVAQKEFSVIDSLYGLSVAGGSSFIDYATEEYLNDYKATNPTYTVKSSASRNVNDNTKLTYSGEEALTVNLEEGTSFLYSKPIDLREVGNDGLTSLISFETRSEDYDYGYVPYLDTSFNQVYDSQGRALYFQDYNKDGSQDVTNSTKYEDAWMTPDTVLEGKKLYVPFIDENGDGTPDIGIVKSYYATKAVARECIITLTDCYDSSRYVKLIVSTPQSTSTAAISPTPYVKVATDNFVQPYGLWGFADSASHIKSYPTTGNTNVSGVPNKVLNYPEGKRIAWTTQLDTVWHYGGKFGGYANNSIKYDYMNLKYDFENSVFYASSTANDGSETTPVGFTDFFNEELYPASLGGYRGFTTGEVYLSISFEKYVLGGETARVDIFGIGGEKITDLFTAEGVNPDLGVSQHKYQDDIIPQINVDFAPTANNGVYVAVGNTYTIPSAVAYDINLIGDVSINVYKNYNTTYQLNVPIVNGNIVIDQADTYTIEYKARDRAGNVATKTIKVFGSDFETDTVGLTQDVNQFASMKAGYTNVFAVPSSVYTLNLFDQLKLKIEIVSDFETVLLADLDGISEIEAFLSANTEYILSYAGKYVINYYLADNAYNNYADPISYEFNVVASDKVVIYDEPFMYRHYIQDAYYDFDKILAYGFANGKPEALGDAQLWIKYDGGNYVQQNSFYSIKIEGQQSIQVKYVYGSTVVETAVYPIVDVDYSDNLTTKKIGMGKYFVGDFDLPDTKLSGKNNTDLYYISNTTEGNNKLQFVKPVDITNFQLSYRIEEECCDFNGIKITLTDVYDSENVLQIYKYKLGDKFYVQYNNDSPKELEDTFIGEDKSFAFTSDAQIIKVSNLTDYIVANNVFTTKDAYLDIELCGIDGVAGVTIKSINDKSLKKSYYDRNAPSFAGTIPSGTFNTGDVVTLSPAIFTDDTSILVAEYTSFIAKCGDAVLTSVDGILLDGSQDPTRSYDVRLTLTGKCSVQYIGKDHFNNSLAPTFYFSVRDNVAPEITFSGDIHEDVIVYAKPGYTVNLNFTMSDNVTPTEALSFKIFVFNTHTAGMYAVSQKSFKLKYEGTYEISVACYDADDNMTIKTFTVVISNEEVR